MADTSFVGIVSVVIAFLAMLSTLVGGLLAGRAKQKAKAEYSAEVEAIASAVQATAPTSGQRREEEW